MDKVPIQYPHPSQSFECPDGTVAVLAVLCSRQANKSLGMDVLCQGYPFHFFRFRTDTRKYTPYRRSTCAIIGDVSAS